MDELIRIFNPHVGHLVKKLMSNSSSYLLDNRSLAEFKKDIKSGHQTEAEIAVRLCITIKGETDKWPTLVPFGIDFAGDFVKNVNFDKVNKQDYLINNQKIEITHSNFLVKRYFHQKVGKILKAIEDKSILIFVNGYKEHSIPEYLWLNNIEIQKYTDLAMKKFGKVGMPSRTGVIANKLAFRYDTQWFDGMWQQLPEIPKSAISDEKIPKEYIKLLANF